MPQLDLYKNSNPRTKKAYPLLLDIQSDLFEELGTRVVIPLSKASVIKKPLAQLMPVVLFEKEKFVLNTPQLAGIPTKVLGQSVGCLSEQRDIVLAAVDFLLTGF